MRRGYKELQGLKGLKGGDKGLQKVTRNTKYYKDVQWVTRCYMAVLRGSMAVTRGYKG